MTLTARELSVMKPGERERLGATLRVGVSTVIPLSMRSKVREITHLHVPEADRGQQLGSKLMRQVCREADEAGITLILTCPNSLRTWYGRLGFIVLQDDIGLLVRPLGHQSLELNKTTRAIDGAIGAMR